MAEKCPQVSELAKVVDPHLENGARILDYECSYLTKPGDNYGSVMLAVQARVQHEDGTITDLPLVAKCPPISMIFWEMFQLDYTFITECTVYETVAKLMRELQLEYELKADVHIYDGFPRYYGSRISLDAKATKVDHSAVLVMENLMASGGYITGNRHKMYEFLPAKLVMEELAQLHALFIALRIKKPKEYGELIRPYFKGVLLDAGVTEDKVWDFYKGLQNIVCNFKDNAKQHLDLLEYLFEKYSESLEKSKLQPVEDLYTSVAHCDLWRNNIMMQFDQKGMACKLKFIDFQTARTRSLMHDIVCFLFSSVDNAVLANNFQKLLHLYYDAFIKCLKNVGVAVAAYNYENFFAEFLRVAPIELYHAIHMTKFILARRSNLPQSFEDLNLNMVEKLDADPQVAKRIEDIMNLIVKLDLVKK